MKFLRNNQELIVLYAVLIFMLAGSIGVTQNYRGQESAFAHHSVREVLAAIVRGK